MPNSEAGGPSVIRSNELPEGYTEGPIIWSGFGNHLSAMQGLDGTDKNVEDLQFNGTVQVRDSEQQSHHDPNPSSIV